jgi:ribonuclease BN (tRNA processing enzyme)
MQHAGVGARAMRVVLRHSVVILCVVVLGGCWTMPRPAGQMEPTIRRIGCEPGSCGNAENQVEVTYLGTSGVLIRYRGAALLTAPFFSKPVLKRVVLSMLPLGHKTSFRMNPDTTLIERFLPSSADNASGILVGHGHYDHLLDVAYIANRRAKSARIYGGPSIRHTLMGDSGLRSENGSRLIVIPLADAGTREHAAEWIYTEDRRFRFMALIATHAPTVKRLGMSYHFADGRLTKDLTSLPGSASAWKLGEPYAFLIDVLAPGDTTPQFRVYYQDAPSTPPHGFPPSVVLRERSVDLAVICAATSTYLSGVPDSLLKILAPRNVMVTHWESLFRRGTLSVHFNAAWDIENFIERVTRGLPPGSRWAMPVPQAVTTFSTAAN